MGAVGGRRQAGRVRRRAAHRDGFFALPAYPLETVVDPTGAGDTFAGGFVGYLARHLDALGDEATLRRAMAYGTALASFNVEEFGTDRVARLEADELHERVADLAADDAPRTHPPNRSCSDDELRPHEYLFTSESVTEGHPDKVADQISDGVLDAVMRDDPTGRVACETLVNTGLVVVSGEISTRDVRRHPGDRSRDDPRDRLHRRRSRLLGRLVRGAQRDRQAVAGHRAGRRSVLRDAVRSVRRRRARHRRRRRPGNDVRLRDQRDRRAHAAADLARAPARPAARARSATTGRWTTCARTARRRSPCATSTACRRRSRSC